MISAFVLTEGRLVQVPISSKEDLTGKETIWIDLAFPTEHERELVQSVFRLELPEDEELKDLQASARHYQDEYGIHIQSTFVQSNGEGASNVSMAFTLHEGRLLTVHEEELTFLRLFRMRARAGAGMVSDAVDIMLGCYALSVEQDADLLEEIYKSLDEIGGLALNRRKDITDRIMRDNMERIAIQEDLNGKLRLDLMDNRRALSFLLRSRVLSPDQNEEVRGILRDIESLNGHTGFIFDKINFLMDGLLGMISLAQNKVIKIFSIAAVEFLPPTLVASIYGDELRSHARATMAIWVSLCHPSHDPCREHPYWYFKHKGWLE